METLSKLFGGAGYVKAMRLFLFNPESAFGAREVSGRSKISLSEAKRVLTHLERAAFIKRRLFLKGDGRRGGIGFSLDQSFPYLSELQNLLIDSVLMKNEEIMRRLGRVGKIKLIISSGVFLREFDDSRVDLLIVGDNIRRSSLENVIKTMESEIGKELRYSVLNTDDYKYRASICDKLIRDIFDFPHSVVTDKIGLSG
ncbi:MAG: hypothetical protein HYT43_01090 [Candidatus Taylorbacteria bacterium]|nr:hypothetical protein [Candidatus Taylorbacteria bacterium]